MIIFFTFLATVLIPRIQIMPIVRSIKNTFLNYSDAQRKIREATSNDPWGPSTTLMLEIADLTYNVLAYSEIMTMIWTRLHDQGKKWRHVYKSLVLLDYIVKSGSERVGHFVCNLKCLFVNKNMLCRYYSLN